ncbi:MAG TPA: hypothetical protein VHE33_19445 [Acidobacteriaceae bacterium]|nr:hypothetical protein [Acidobacteriaceae bacterium]
MRRYCAAILLVAFAGAALHGQRTRTPSLDEILQRLETNLRHYDRGVPNFFCDEHALSSQVGRNPPDQKTVTDSVFRLKRTANPDHTTTLAESREIRSVNGKPPTSQRMDGPSVLSGIFEGGLAVVSQNQTACMKYQLQRGERIRRTDPYLIHFATILNPQNAAGCFLQEKSQGWAYVDPASMQVTHLEISTPRHVIVAGDSDAPPVIGMRKIVADFAPVSLGDEIFWMPSAITMRNVSGSGTFHMMVWSFRATYRNYHRMEVTSRIVPGSEAPVR